MGLPLKEMSDFQRLAERGAGLLLSDLPGLFRSPGTTPAQLRQHAMMVDRILGMDLAASEDELCRRAQRVAPDGNLGQWGPRLHQGRQTWVGLDPQRLNTPYDLLRRMCGAMRLRSGETLADLGAAHGRMGFVMAQHAPGARFLGIEYVPERAAIAEAMYRRWNLRHASCRQGDLFAEGARLPVAQAYFIYDYGLEAHVRSTLAAIGRLAPGARVLARGEMTLRLLRAAPGVERGEDHGDWQIFRFTAAARIASLPPQQVGSSIGA